MCGVATGAGVYVKKTGVPLRYVRARGPLTGRNLIEEQSRSKFHIPAPRSHCSSTFAKASQVYQSGRRQTDGAAFADLALFAGIDVDGDSSASEEERGEKEDTAGEMTRQEQMEQRRADFFGLIYGEDPLPLTNPGKKIKVEDAGEILDIGRVVGSQDHGVAKLPAKVKSETGSVPPSSSMVCPPSSSTSSGNKNTCDREEHAQRQAQAQRKIKQAESELRERVADGTRFDGVEEFRIAATFCANQTEKCKEWHHHNKAGSQTALAPCCLLYSYLPRGAYGSGRDAADEVCPFGCFRLLMNTKKQA